MLFYLLDYPLHLVNIKQLHSKILPPLGSPWAFKFLFGVQIKLTEKGGVPSQSFSLLLRFIDGAGLKKAYSGLKMLIEPS